MSPVLFAILMGLAALALLVLMLLVGGWLVASKRAGRMLRPCEWLHSLNPKWLEP